MLQYTNYRSAKRYAPQTACSSTVQPPGEYFQSGAGDDFVAVLATSGCDARTAMLTSELQ